MNFLYFSIIKRTKKFINQQQLPLALLSKQAAAHYSIFIKSILKFVLNPSNKTIFL